MNSKKLKLLTISNDWLRDKGIDVGHSNGYVRLPNNHPLYGKDYDEINNYVSVHGGLTYSRHISKFKIDLDDKEDEWIVGFDTCHCDDNLENWSEKLVIEETIRLREQLENLWNI